MSSPPGEKDREEFDLAWEAYLRNRAYGAVASVLAAEYERAVDDLAGGDEDADPARGQRLAFHLMMLFNNGFLGLEEAGLLARFFRLAPPVLRAHALELLARGFYRRTEVVTDERRDRLKAIWATVLRQPRRMPRNHPSWSGSGGGSPRGSSRTTGAWTVFGGRSRSPTAGYCEWERL